MQLPALIRPAWLNHRWSRPTRIPPTRTIPIRFTGIPAIPTLITHPLLSIGPGIRATTGSMPSEVIIRVLITMALADTWVSVGTWVSADVPVSAAGSTAVGIVSGPWRPTTDY